MKTSNSIRRWMVIAAFLVGAPAVSAAAEVSGRVVLIEPYALAWDAANGGILAFRLSAMPSGCVLVYYRPNHAETLRASYAAVLASLLNGTTIRFWYDDANNTCSMDRDHNNEADGWLYISGIHVGNG